MKLRRYRRVAFLILGLCLMALHGGNRQSVAARVRFNPRCSPRGFVPQVTDSDSSPQGAGWVARGPTPRRRRRATESDETNSAAEIWLSRSTVDTISRYTTRASARCSPIASAANCQACQTPPIRRGGAEDPTREDDLTRAGIHVRGPPGWAHARARGVVDRAVQGPHAPVPVPRRRGGSPQSGGSPGGAAIRPSR
jgi:hypothetical protein